MTSVSAQHAPFSLAYGSEGLKENESKLGPLLVPAYAGRQNQTGGAFRATDSLENLVSDVKARQGGQRHTIPWMMTLTDLTMLTLAFFVLLYSMQTPISSSLKSASSALTRSELPRFDARISPPDVKRNATPIQHFPSGSLAYVSSILDRGMKQDPRLSGTKITHKNGEIRLQLGQHMFIDGGLPKVSEQAIPQIVALSRLLASLRNQIEVEIATNNTSLSAQSGRRFLDWSTALAQGAAFARALRIAGYAKPVRVKVVAPEAGKTALGPISSNSKQAQEMDSSADLALVLKAYNYGT